MIYNCCYLLIFVVVWFQKISMPPTRREFEISEGWRGVKEPENSGGEGGWNRRFSFQMPFHSFTFLFRNIDKTTSSKQPRSKEIKTLEIFRTLFAYV